MVLGFLVLNVIPACASLLCWGMGNTCSPDERSQSSVRLKATGVP